MTRPGLGSLTFGLGGLTCCKLHLKLLSVSRWALCSLLHSSLLYLLYSILPVPTSTRISTTLVKAAWPFASQTAEPWCFWLRGLTALCRSSPRERRTLRSPAPIPFTSNYSQTQRGFDFNPYNYDTDYTDPFFDIDLSFEPENNPSFLNDFGHLLPVPAGPQRGQALPAAIEATAQQILASASHYATDIYPLALSPRDTTLLGGIPKVEKNSPDSSPSASSEAVSAGGIQCTWPSCNKSFPSVTPYKFVAHLI